MPQTGVPMYDQARSYSTQLMKEKFLQERTLLVNFAIFKFYISKPQINRFKAFVYIIQHLNNVLKTQYMKF